MVCIILKYDYNSRIILAFSLLNTTPKTHNLKEEKLNLGSWFAGIQPIVTWLQGRKIITKGHDGVKLLYSWQWGSREGEQPLKGTDKTPEIAPKAHIHDRPSHIQECALLICQVFLNPVQD